jgi:methyltransferase (TIGR00027 family)
LVNGPVTLSRSRYTEDCLEEAVRRGVRQYVILGAGLDSFALRHLDLQDRLRVFEVDHPSSQAWKRQRLDDLGLHCPPNLTFAPIDFEHQTLRAGLEAAGFDFAEPAVFSWIGVTMYLTLEAIRATLETVASCPAGTRIVLTYNQPPSALQGFGLSLETTLSKLIADLGEPMISLFVPGEIEGLLRQVGFVDIVHIGPDEAVRAYFPGRADVRFAGAQRLAIGEVAHRRVTDPTRESGSDVLP